MNVRYTVAKTGWPSRGYGNHRAVVEVERKAPAVVAHLPWRRWDQSFYEKGVVVQDMTTGKTIETSALYNRDFESGDVVFEPETVPGRYAIYYMPYNQKKKFAMNWEGEYIPDAMGELDKRWLRSNNLPFYANAKSMFSFMVGFAEEITVRKTTHLAEYHAGKLTFGNATKTNGFGPGFGGDDYTTAFDVVFANARGSSISVFTMFQQRLYNSAQGYKTSLGNIGGTMTITVRRVDDTPRGVETGPELGRREFTGKRAVWGMTKPGRMSVVTRAEKDRTVIEAKYVDRDGSEFALTGADASPERYTTGKAPAWRMYPGNHGKSPDITWLRNIRVTASKSGDVLVDTGWFDRPPGFADMFRFYPTIDHERGGKLATREEDGAASFGNNMQIMQTDRGFASDDYTVSYDLAFENARGTSLQTAVLFQKQLYLASKGYVVAIGNHDARLYYSIRRVDATPDGKEQSVVLADLGEHPPLAWGSGKPGKVAVTVEGGDAQTEVTARYTPFGRDEPYVLEAVDRSPERYRTGSAPTFKNYPGSHATEPGVWMSNLRIVDNKSGETVLDANALLAAEKDPPPDSSEYRNTFKPADLSRLPTAKLVEFQARNEFNRLYPMGVPATAEETEALAAKLDVEVGIFPESRHNPVFMAHAIPITWAQQGPRDTFTGSCRPDEYFAFQIGMWAAHTPVDNFRITFTDAVNEEGQKIPAAGFVCYNQTGVDQNGRPFTPEFHIPEGKVRSIWNGVMAPRNGSGTYRGSMTLSINGGKIAKQIPFELTVAGKPIRNHGDDDPRNFTRLRWFNSTLGLDDDTVSYPYEPVKSDGKTVEVINRTIALSPLGMPAQATSNGFATLAAPVRFDVTVDNARVAWRNAAKADTKKAPAAYENEAVAEAADGALKLRVTNRYEYDGTIYTDLHLTATRSVTVQDARLIVPYKRGNVRYMDGFGFNGGKADFAERKFKWSRVSPSQMVYMGRPEAGFVFRALSERDRFFGGGYEADWDEGGLMAWRNSVREGEEEVDRGGGGWRAVGDAVEAEFHTGEFALEAGQTRKLRASFAVTPFKPLRKNPWGHRFAWGDGSRNGNVYHFHHSTTVNPYINYPFLTVPAIKALSERHRQNGRSITLYYTVRELSNYAPEIKLLRSFGDEILKTGGHPIFAPDAIVVSGSGGGHPWLQEHLSYDYSPAWHTSLPDGEVCAGIGTEGNSRLANYYIEGLNYLQREAGQPGIYLDGIGYGRKTMQRMAKILSGNGTREYELVMHTGTWFANPYNRECEASWLLGYIVHVPLVTQLMPGEVVPFDQPPDGWLMNMSGIPYGLDATYYPVPGPERLFREMLFAGTSCGGWTAYGESMREFWDRYDIYNAKVLGWWDDNCPVETGNEKVLASAFSKPGKTFIALATWSDDDEGVKLKVDWKALGLDPAKVELRSRRMHYKGTILPPARRKEVSFDLQPEREFGLDEEIPLKAKDGGWVLIAEEQ